MHNPMERRALIRAVLLNALRAIVLLSFGPKVGGMLLRLADRVLQDANKNERS